MNPRKNPKRGTVIKRVSGENPERSIGSICISFCALVFAEIALVDGPKNSGIKVKGHNHAQTGLLTDTYKKLCDWLRLS